jgi:HlyD family secretion protein
MPHSPRDLRWRLRRGNALTFTVVSLVGVAGLALAGWWFLGRSNEDETPRFLMSTVSRGNYDFVVIEQGEVESGTNVELRCEVRSRGGGGGGDRGGGGGGGITIIEVIAEGTMVEPGDVLVRLDSSMLEQELITQQIRCTEQESLKVQAENTLSAAEIALKEYLEGTYVAEEKTIISEAFVAEQALRTAQGQLESAQRLFERGIITALQVEATKYSVDDSRNKVEVAQTKLQNLRTHTRDKMVKQFESDIATAKARLSAAETSLSLEQTKLAEIEDQIAKCTIIAPAPGQVVYANQYDSWRGSSGNEFVVAEGATVRERQVIIRLPNAADMRVKATVNEARVTLVRPGLPVTIRVDALKDEVIHGEVTKVNQYAEAGGWSTGSVKKYATFIKILNPPAELRSGMNAEARIHVDRRQDALQVPVQALAEHKGHFFCLVQNGNRYETREVELASTNDKVAVIDSGLVEGDRVVLDPRSAGRWLALPDLPDPLSRVQIAEIPAAPSGASPLATPSLAMTGAGPPGGAGEGARGGGGKGKKGNFTAATAVERALEESDADKDGKISMAELSTMDDRRKEMFEGADKDGDGFIDRAELLTAANSFIARMRQEREARGGGPGGNGPAGGGE